jgi:hypothetical protein
MMNDDERERRVIEFLALEVRGLVVRSELPDGSAELYFPQPHHPDVLSFRAARTTDERLHEQVMEALRRMAAERRIYDTGRRKWSERTRSYHVVWEAVPPKNEQN